MGLLRGGELPRDTGNNSGQDSVPPIPRVAKHERDVCGTQVLCPAHRSGSAGDEYQLIVDRLQRLSGIGRFARPHLRTWAYQISSAITSSVRRATSGWRRDPSWSKSVRASLK